MAVRRIHGRILSLVAERLSQPSSTTGPASHILPITNSLFTRDEFYRRRRRFQTLSEPVNQAAVDGGTESNSAGDLPSPVTGGGSPVNYNVASNLKVSSRHDLAMVFTCRVCETRSVKTLCRESYEKGVVVARCEGCNNLHLIADRLGWFGEPGSVEELLAARGEEVKKGSAESLSLTLEDLVGKKNVEN